MKPTAAAAAFHAHKSDHRPAAFRRATPIEPVMTGKFADFIAGVLFRNLVIGVIIFSAVLMGFEVSDTVMNSPYGAWVKWLDRAVTTIFVLELLAKLAVFRLRFFRDGWNVFDLLIVLISLVPATQGLRVIRTLRVLRILRLLSAIPSMRMVITGLLRAIPGMLSAIALLAIIVYVFAIIGTQLYGDTCFPGYLDQCTYFFGDLGKSLYTLFQIMTLESWSHGIVRPIADVFPSALGFFVLYVVISAFAALNLFIGVVVNAMDSANHSEEDSDEEDVSLADLKAEIGELKKLITDKRP